MQKTIIVRAVSMILSMGLFQTKRLPSPPEDA